MIKAIRTAGLVVACLAVCLASAGCTASTTGTTRKMPELTLQQAKDRVLGQERKIVALVPAQAVTDKPFINDKSPLMACRDTFKKWTGTAQVNLVPGTDDTALLDTLRDSVKKDEPWTVTDGTDIFGDRQLKVVHPDGTQLLVGVWKKPFSLQIDAASGCFDLPEYEYPNQY